VAGAKGFDNLAKALPWLDIFVPSLDEARNVTGEESPEKIIARFRAAGAPGILGVKLGKEGCLLNAPDVYMEKLAVGPGRDQDP